MVVIGQRQHALHPVTVAVLEIEQDATAPQVFRLLRVGVRDRFRILEIGTGDAKIRELDECLSCEEEPVGLRRPGWRAEGRVVVQDLLELPVRELVEAGLLRVFAVRRQSQSFRQVNFQSRARAAVGCRIDRLRARQAEADLVLHAKAVRQVAGRRRGIERKEPEVVLVVYDQVLAVARVRNAAVRRLRSRMVELEVDEARRTHGERSRRARVEIVHLVFVVLPIDEGSTVGRDAGHMARHRVLRLEHERALARGRVHAVEVRLRPSVIGEVRSRVPAHRPAAVRRDLEIAHRGVRERNKPRCGDIERLAESEVPILFGADHLLRLDVHVAGAPDVDVGDGVRAGPPRRIRGAALRHGREEHALAVLGPGERCAITDHPGFRESRGCCGIERGRAHVGTCERAADVREHHEHVIALAHALDLASLEHGETGPLVVPREPAVDPRVVV